MATTYLGLMAALISSYMMSTSGAADAAGRWRRPLEERGETLLLVDLHERTAVPLYSFLPPDVIIRRRRTVSNG